MYIEYYERRCIMFYMLHAEYFITLLEKCYTVECGIFHHETHNVPFQSIEVNMFSVNVLGKARTHYHKSYR